MKLDFRVIGWKAKQVMSSGVILWPLLFVFAALIFLAAKPAKDDTDQPDGRSGMILKTDALTGCHYLVYKGITPRLNKDGKQVGCK